ncbi:hypothetical protein [Leisingera sp. ANG-M7]|uniref:hypothetical protein n=1 Tax=Leisingera sp. ANG-M7 TaxID=1577902 RepID=UPI00126A2B91|nr:hypothetical protein [Leisingera sp. ANG-M7]
MPVGALIGGSLIGGVASASSASKAAKAQTAAADQANQTQRYIFDRSVELTEPQRKQGLNALSALSYELGLADRPESKDYQIAEVFTPGTPAQPGNALQPNHDGLFFNPYTKSWSRNRPPSIGGMAATPDTTTYMVGDRSFDSRGAAQDWIDENQGFDYRGFQETPGFQFNLDQGNKAIERMAAARGLRLSGGTLKAGADYASGLASNEYGNYLNRLAGMAGVGQTATNQQIGAGQNYAGAVSQNALAAGNARASGYMNQANALNSTIGDISGIYTLGKMGVFS